ncbi:MAG: transcriptional regulator [Alphaproteobacteria bacterium]|nr:MAG: transcriptional regulator [Alphaproteobacteria bacterium]
MAGGFEILETAVRSGAAALNLLVAMQLARVRPLRPVLVCGAFFAAGVAAYILLSFAPVAAALGPAALALVPLAVFNPAFFWCFALAIFDDAFEWRWWHGLPFALLLAFLLIRLAAGPVGFPLMVVPQALVLLLLAHVVVLAIRDIGGDLVDARRRLRVALAVLIPMVGIPTAAAEIYETRAALPGWLGSLQAVVILALSFLFALWITRIRAEMLVPGGAGPRPQPERLGPADRIELDRLRALVAQGVCLEPGLSIGSLGALVAIPEHRVRRLINQGLGYRNFAAFLNDHRIDEARRRLADPARAREQVITIAFELGYASLAPFNRAFRERVGMSPTEFRAAALARPRETGKRRSKSEKTPRS